MAPGTCQETWTTLARARVLVHIGELGADRSGGEFTGKMGWLEALRSLTCAAAADSALLGKIHQVTISRATEPRVSIRPSAGGSSPVVLELRFSSGGTPGRPPAVEAPTATAIAKALGPLGPRPRLDKFEFDNRFLLFAAQLGFGVTVLDSDRRDARGGYAFHAALAAYGERVKDLKAAPVGLAERKGAPPSGTLRNLQDLLYSEVDPLFHPQLALRPATGPDAGLEMPFSPTFPLGAPRSFTPFLEYEVSAGGVVVFSLDDADAAFGRFIDEVEHARGTPGQLEYRKRPFRCGKH